MIKRRFFAGFMKSQAKWLNSMAKKGYRLVRAGKLEYEFSECEPGKYIYSVEYIGDRSFEEGEKYKAFLEGMGYRVFYKNMNLDYSVARVSYRPWADKGGRFSTNSTTFNRELLIVEKENDGKPFELHTETEDVADYYMRLSRPWIFAVFLMIVLLIVFWPNVLYMGVFGGLAVLFFLPVVYSLIRIHKIKKEKKLEE